MKIEEPWTLGKYPISVFKFLISSNFRPSGLCSSSRIAFLTASVSREYRALFIFEGSWSSPSASIVLFISSEILSSLSFLSPGSFSVFKKSCPICFCVASKADLSSSETSGADHFFTPTLFWISIICSTICPFTSWANCNASRRTLSETKFAADSTIITESPVPATINSKSLDSSSSYVGLTTNSPSIKPITHAPIGSWNGKSEIARAVEAPIIPIAG